MVIIDARAVAEGSEGTCREIRHLNLHRPLLVLGEEPDQAQTIRALAAGADGYLVTPMPAALLAAHIEALLRRTDDRTGRAERHLAAMRRMLDGAWEVPLRSFVRSPFVSLANALGASVDATYCRFTVREGVNRLRIRASAGHRILDGGPDDRSLELATLPYAQQALRERRSVVLDFENPAHAATPERGLLFTLTTRRAVLIPFSSRRIDGVLAIGEERVSRSAPFDGENLATLEFVAHRIGDILRMGDLLRRTRVAERRRQLQVVKREERTRLARELHDEVGQSLSGLLLRLRLARSEGSIGIEDISLLEKAAQDALDAARSVAYDLRHQNGATEALRDARDFAETILGPAGCGLTWIDRRADTPLDSRTARTAARVIKESVTNIARHSHARTAEVMIEEAGNRLRVTVRDDGHGFAPTAIPLHRSGRGLGLLGNRERLAQLGGTFQLRSRTGVGTAVVFELPWRRRKTVAKASLVSAS
jgi:signal transduction histidine kinase